LNIIEILHWIIIGFGKTIIFDANNKNTPMKRIIACITICLSLNFMLKSQNTEKIYLSGTGNDNTVDWEFKVSDGRKSGSWSTIPVPSCWELEGFGTYNYGHDMPKANEKGHYRYSFSVPQSWEGKRITIVFDGSMTDTEVKINGRSAGPIHKGAFYQFKHDISDLLRYGQDDNLLEVIVSKMSSNESVNMAERKADYWVFGGIFRPVWLEVTPKEAIEWTAIDAKADGSFLINVYPTEINEANQVEAQIYTLDNEPVGQTFSKDVNENAEIVTLTTILPNPELWSPEFPNLYKVKVTLSNNGNAIHEKEERFGFRTVEVRERDGIYVNDQKIMFKGVNRHSFYPSSGRTTSKLLSIQDVQLMKDMNMNAVRMSHYPPDKHFLDACDSLGLFVLNELAGWQAPPYDTKVGKQLVKEMVIRDVNHPSIVIWDNGNEGGWNTELDDEFAKYDPQNRQVIHPWQIFRNTDTQHYKPYGYGVNSFFYGRDIFFPTEILHGLYDGGHGAGLDDYWNLMLQNPLSAGCFLWCFVDEGVVRTDKDGMIDTDGNHAPDGILGPYREKEGSFYTIKEIWSPVYIAKENITAGFNGNITVENRFHYTNLNQCEFEWSLVNFPLPSDESIEPTVQASGKAIIPSVIPQHKGTIQFELPEGWEASDALFLKVTNPHGREIITRSWALKKPAAIAEQIVPKSSDNAPTVSENKIFVTVNANGIEYTFDKTMGTLNMVSNEDGRISFSDGPAIAHADATFQELNHYEEGNNYIIEIISENGFNSASWTIMGNGWAKLEYDYRHRGEFDFMGVNFAYPEEQINGVKVLSNGPYRVWKNRMKGVNLGVWDKPYNNTVTGASWDYPEFKGYYSQFYWTVVDSKEQPFTIVSATEDLYLRLYTPVFPDDARHAQAPFPDGNISFMHAIPAIGTKFMEAEKLGPKSQRLFYNGGPSKTPPFSAVLYFDFSSK
jgi:hypothetical protein